MADLVFAAILIVRFGLLAIIKRGVDMSCIFAPLQKSEKNSILHLSDIQYWIVHMLNSLISKIDDSLLFYCGTVFFYIGILLCAISCMLRIADII